MVQREVAERIAAPPGKMSYLSVFVQYHARVRIAFGVPAAAFEPEPAVESSVIVVEPYDADDRLGPEDEDELWRLVQAAFRERRKMIHNVLSRQLPLDAGRVTGALETAGIAPDRRPQTLAVGEWLALHDALGPIGPDGRGRRANETATVTDPLRRLSPVVRLAPAKLNLTLAVIGRRDDGYHTLHSVFVPLALADRLSLAPVGGDRDTLHVTGGDAGPPADNLVLRALAVARAAVGGGWSGGPGPAPALAARLEKRIPVAAGLAGGSSDAAATVDAALEAWGAELDEEARLAVAARLGSDVPFFLAGGPALVEGRGEQVAPLHGLHGSPGVVLVTPVVAVPTPDVFAAFDAIRTHGDGAVRMSSAHLAEELRSGLTATALVARAGVLASANDLLPATSLVVPALVPFKRAISRLLGRPVGLSGSGPTLWALYDSGAEAATAAEIVRDALRDGSIAAPGSAEPFVCATTIVGHSQQGREP